MSESDLVLLLRSLDRPMNPPGGLSTEIWRAVESELSGSPAVTRIDRRVEPRWKGPLAAVSAGAVILVVGFATWSLVAPSEPPVASTTTTAPTTTLPAATSVPVAPPETVVGTAEDGFSDVLAALDEASARWQPDEDFRYAYLVTVACDCPDAGTRWMRQFQQGSDDDPWDVVPILSRIRDDIETGPARVEVALSPEDGHPTYYSVQWPEGSAADDLVLGVDRFHEITLAPSEFAGDWRFTSGVVDGNEFGNPVVHGPVYLTLGPGYISFPVDCNTGGGMVDIYEGAFGVGELGTTDGGCSEYSAEAEQFVTGVARAERIGLDGAGLLLTGPGVELRFVSPQPVESLGDLPLTAAGETVLLEFPDGRSRGVVYTIEGPNGRLGESVSYVLTAEADGVDSEASWSVWGGEFEVPDVEVTGPGPDRISMPETIQVGDYRLCSPYWEPEPFCFDLSVRLAGAPWFVTAGVDGVILHDADGTSSVISEDEAVIAFYVQGRVVLQRSAGSLVIVDGDRSSEVTLDPGEVLLDVALVDGRPLALVTDRSSSTTIVDLESGDRVDVGPNSVEARIHGTTILLRLSDTGLEARSLTAALLWEATLDAETMVVPADPGVVRLDRFGDLNTESDPPFRQYLETRLLDLATGAELDSYEYELAIPLEGDEITERCVRAELRDGLMLCPQPDGRLVTLGVEGGDMIDFPAGRGGIGAYARADG